MFRTVASEEKIPIGWRLSTVNDVKLHQQESRDAINLPLKWSIYMMSDGKISGSGYDYEVEYGNFPGLGYKLLVRGKILHNEIYR